MKFHLDVEVMIVHTELFVYSNVGTLQYEFLCKVCILLLYFIDYYQVLNNLLNWLVFILIHKYYSR